VDLVLEVGQTPIYVEADWNRLTQVIGNLLQNASKFTCCGGHTRVSVRSDTSQQKAFVSVRDTGIGIEPEVLSRLFQPFIQAEQPLDRNLGGLGLGLALVKGFVELHGGTVNVTSQGRGKGAEFTIELAAATAAAESAATHRDQPAVRHRILVIEDNRDAADTLSEALEYCNHQVEVAYSGDEGLIKARQFRPSVILCDIGLPVMDGYAVARAVRSDEALGGMLLIALSGYTQPEDQRRAREAGFDQHIAKPPNLDEIAALLQSWSGRRD
jgi:two-component system CheB/CheR fusion protein